MVQMSYVSEAFVRTKALPPVCPIRNGYAANPFNSSEIIVCLNFNVTAIYHCPTGYSFNGTKCVLRNPTHFDLTHHCPKGYNFTGGNCVRQNSTHFNGTHCKF